LEWILFKEGHYGTPWLNNKLGLTPVKRKVRFNRAGWAGGLTLMNTDKKRKFVSPAARKNLLQTGPLYFRMRYRRQAA